MSADKSGLTQMAFGLRTGMRNGAVSTTNESSCCRRSAALLTVKPVPALPT